MERRHFSTEGRIPTGMHTLTIAALIVLSCIVKKKIENENQNDMKSNEIL